MISEKDYLFLCYRQSNRNINFFGIKVQLISTNVSPISGIPFIKNEFYKGGMSQLIDSELKTKVKTVGVSSRQIGIIKN
jgi:hypothetical protein